MNCVRYIEHLQCQKRYFQVAEETSRCFGQPKIVATNSNIVAVAGLIKRETKLTVKNIANSVGILSGSVHKILTQQLKPI